MNIDESLMIFIIIVFIAGGILQIILFFKLWKMTNHVETMKFYLEKLMYMKEREYEDKYGDDD